MPELPTSDDGLLADIADLGGTDPELLADEEFSELLTTAVRADYEAFNRYDPSPDVRIGADIHVLGGHDDHRIGTGVLRQWENTPRDPSPCRCMRAGTSTSTTMSTRSPRR